jgi:Putative auto-transporter adhesin, head GIN domain
MTHDPVLASSPQSLIRIAGRLMLATLAASAVFASAVDAAEVVKESRSLTGTFKSVRLVGSADLVLTQSDTQSLSVEGDKDAVQFLVAEIRGDELVLRYEPRSKFVWWNNDHKSGPRFLLSTKNLERISTAGNGDVRSDAWTSAGDFEISVSGGSDIKIGSLAARKLLVRISGSGDVTLAGGVLEQNVKIAGSGDYRSGDLKSANAVIAISGSGDATLTARDTLTVNIAGSGDVKYYGRPTITKSIAGSGSITGLGEKP